MSAGAWVELILLVALALGGSKRVAMAALLGGVFYLSQYQAVSLGGLNMFSHRFLEIAVFLRVVARRELSTLKLNPIDWAFVALYCYTTIIYLLRTTDDAVFQVGVTIDALLAYFACRALIITPDDFRSFLRTSVILLVPFAVLVVKESLTTGQAIAFTGWQPQGIFAYTFRNGRARCMGSFRHPSLLGTISVSFIPMYIGMAFRKVDRKWAVLGIASCLAIIYAANSGGPISGTAFGCLAWCCWRFRTKMRRIRWGIVGFITLAALLMKAPVWYLLDRISAVSGGDGWHRSYLLDVTARNIGKWCLMGMSFSETSSWFAYSLGGNGQADITNQFVLFGLTAGVGALGLYILLFVRGFSALGKALQNLRDAAQYDSEAETLLWGLGCMLAAHIINQLGITYFDQSHIFWFAQLACISALCDWHSKPVAETEEQLEVDKTDLSIQNPWMTATQ
jgi:hypothetical protein